jgi:hypothetical protein
VEWQKMRIQSLIFALLFDCIGQATSPRNQLESSSKNPQTCPEASSSQLLKELGEGRIELTTQFQTHPPPPTLVHILCTFFSNSRIVEAFGFKVALQGECQNSPQKFLKSEKQHQRCITHGTYDPSMATHNTHGQNIQI